MGKPLEQAVRCLQDADDQLERMLGYLKTIQNSTMDGLSPRQTRVVVAEVQGVQVFVQAATRHAREALEKGQ